MLDMYLLDGGDYSGANLTLFIKVALFYSFKLLQYIFFIYVIKVFIQRLCGTMFWFYDTEKTPAYYCNSCKFICKHVNKSICLCLFYRKLNLCQRKSNVECKKMQICSIWYSDFYRIFNSCRYKK